MKQLRIKVVEAMDGKSRLFELPDGRTFPILYSEALPPNRTFVVVERNCEALDNLLVYEDEKSGTNCWFGKLFAIAGTNALDTEDFGSGYVIKIISEEKALRDLQNMCLGYA